MFSSDFSWIFKNTFYSEHLSVTASGLHIVGKFTKALKKTSILQH